MDQDVEHDAMLVDRPPEIMKRAVDADEDLVQMPDIARLWAAFRSRFANSAPDFPHQARMLSCVIDKPRSARISSTSRRLKLNTWYSQTAWLMIAAGNR